MLVSRRFKEVKENPKDKEAIEFEAVVSVIETCETQMHEFPGVPMAEEVLPLDKVLKLFVAYYDSSWKTECDETGVSALGVLWVAFSRSRSAYDTTLSEKKRCDAIRPLALLNRIKVLCKSWCRKPANPSEIDELAQHAISCTLLDIREITDRMIRDIEHNNSSSGGGGRTREEGKTELKEAPEKKRMEGEETKFDAACMAATFVPCCQRFFFPVLLTLDVLQTYPVAEYKIDDQPWMRKWLELEVTIQASDTMIGKIRNLYYTLQLPMGVEMWNQRKKFHASDVISAEALFNMDCNNDTEAKAMKTISELLPSQCIAMDSGADSVMRSAYILGLYSHMFDTSSGTRSLEFIKSYTVLNCDLHKKWQLLRSESTEHGIPRMPLIVQISCDFYVHHSGTLWQHPKIHGTEGALLVWGDIVKTKFDCCVSPGQSIKSWLIDFLA